tara:strand:+ start:360 stop:2393 length:2034 start_codon:yes stop_codon:yes gene_type:complete
MPERAPSIQNSAHTNSAARISRYRPEIDGLRAFAVIVVIINHFNKDILPGGYLGVDIFFVISGYVITSSLYERTSKDFKDFISGFYERRIKRLVPALSIFILITSIAICLFNPSPGSSLRTGLASLFGLSNIYLLNQSTDYFAQSTELNVFTHTWSLGVEEQFYILFPFLIWSSGFGRQTKDGARNLFLIVGALTIASLIGFLYLYKMNQPAAYFLMPSRFWEMAAGCLIFIGFQKRASVEQLLEKVPPLLVMAVIVGVMYLPMSLAAVSTVAVVALSSILIASLKKQTAAFKVFTNPKVVYIGLISYSLYLWHWGVLSISRWTIGIHWWSVPFQVALMLGLAIASYRWIETPLRKGNWLGKRWKTLMVGGGVLVTLSGGLFALVKTPKGKFYTGSSFQQRERPLFERRLGRSHLTAEKCHKNTSLENLFTECKLPVNRISGNQKTFAFVGDSHALSLLNAEELLFKKGIRIIHYSRGGCPFPSTPFGTNPPDCSKFLNNAERYLLQDLKRGDSIVIYNYHLSHLGGANMKDTRHNFIDKNGLLSTNSSKKIRLYFEGLSIFSAKAKEKGISIFLIGSAYRNNDLHLTKEWFRVYDPAVVALEAEKTNAKNMNEVLFASINKFDLTNVDFIDPLEAIDDTCIEDIDSYYKCFDDSDHVSIESSRKIIALLLQKYSQK